MPHGKDAKLRRAASRELDPRVLQRRLALQAEELKHAANEIETTRHMLGCLEIQHGELLALMREQREANETALREAASQVQARSREEMSAQSIRSSLSTSHTLHVPLRCSN